MVGASPPVSPGRSTIVGESKGFGAPPGVSIMVGASEGGRFRSEEESPLLDGLRTAAPPSPWSGGLPFGRPRPSSSMGDRKSTRLNSSHGYISYAVFCLKKKNKNKITATSYRVN